MFVLMLATIGGNDPYVKNGHVLIGIGDICNCSYKRPAEPEEPFSTCFAHTPALAAAANPPPSQTDLIPILVPLFLLFPILGSIVWLALRMYNHMKIRKLLKAIPEAKGAQKETSWFDFKLTDINFPKEDYGLTLEELGQGNFGSVGKGWATVNGQKITAAIKSALNNSDGEDAGFNLRALINEAKILAHIKNKGRVVF